MCLKTDSEKLTPEQVGLEKAHAEKYYGKYSSGYNRGLALGREERWRITTENSRLRQFLRELQDLNDQCDGDILPSEYAERLSELVD